MKLEAVKKQWLTGHVVLGALLGVVVLHPATSVIYWWFETPDENLRYFVAQRVVHAFAPAMLPMTGLFAAIGAGLGLTFGLAYRAKVSDRPGPTFLQQQLARSLTALLAAGEGEQLEFEDENAHGIR